MRLERLKCQRHDFILLNIQDNNYILDRNDHILFVPKFNNYYTYNSFYTRKVIVREKLSGRKLIIPSSNSLIHICHVFDERDSISCLRKACM